MLERDSYRGPALRALHTASAGVVEGGKSLVSGNKGIIFMG
jgi:hypothetical protein